ncbi:MAG: DegT/DnrJ/EryC1/StrS family aminotransferase [Phycisphaeraceae bacterium]|nr:DegT/DnrJ/EryC1/StrS family aminotransferase [Phycisphaeraceae bacterium]
MQTMTDQKLAIHGGKPIIPSDLTFKMWPEIGPDDEALVLASLRQSSHASGPHVKLLGEEFAAWNGNKHCRPTNSGTSALQMCVAGCGVQAGDEVITTALSWTSSATCIIHHNAIPVFVDADWETMHIDPKCIEAAITPQTKAILVVHYFGVACDMDAIMAIAKKHDLAVIEDACQAHGATFNGKKVGTIGHAGAFSLNQNKNLCGGEGGFFVTNDQAIFDRGCAIGGFSDMRPADSGRDYHTHGLGWMYSTTDLNAAFALGQLRKLDKTNAQARANWHQLDDLLTDTPNLIRPYSTEHRPTNGYAYILRVDPAYAQKRGVALTDLTNAISLASTAEGLPLSRANWLLPAHTIFQVKDAYGKGSPWSDGHCKRDVDYNLDQYPLAQQCVDTCLWNVFKHRPPNGEAQIQAFAGAIRKVFENLDDVTVEQK